MTSFSILTPSYGYARFIEDAIDSIGAQQTLATVEHVVADGASIDGTQEVLQQQGRDGLVWFSEPDEGQSDALNRAFRRASGDVIGWLNADEFYLRGALEAVRHEFATADADVVYGDSVFVDESGRLLRLVPQHPFSAFTLRHYGCYIASCAFFVRRETLQSLRSDPWDQGLRAIMDWDLYLSFATSGARFAYLPHPLGAFRIHGERVTASRLGKHDPERLQVRRRYGIPNAFAVREATAVAGRLNHVRLKLVAGGYRRQLRVSRRAGSDLRWW